MMHLTSVLNLCILSLPNPSSTSNIEWHCMPLGVKQRDDVPDWKENGWPFGLPWTSLGAACCIQSRAKVLKFSLMFFGVFLHIHSHCNEVKRINPQRMKSTQYHHPTHCHSAVLVSVMLRLAWDAAARSASHLRPNHKLLRFVDTHTHTPKKKCGNGWTWWESWGIVNWIYLNQMLQQQPQKLRLLLAKLMYPTWSSLSQSLGMFWEHGPHGTSIE